MREAIATIAVNQRKYVHISFLYVYRPKTQVEMVILLNNTV